MSDLSDLTDRLEERMRLTGSTLLPETNLIEAIRSALGSIGEVYGSVQTLEGLDEATETSLEVGDMETLLFGAELQLLVSLLAVHFTDFSGAFGKEETINARIKESQRTFDEAKEKIRRRFLENSTDCPYAEWIDEEEFDWEQ